MVRQGPVGPAGPRWSVRTLAAGQLHATASTNTASARHNRAIVVTLIVVPPNVDSAACVNLISGNLAKYRYVLKQKQGLHQSPEYGFGPAVTFCRVTGEVSINGWHVLTSARFWPKA